MKLNFCTLFDSNYLSRGIAMWQSLSQNCPDSHLYIYAFDDKSYSVLSELKFPNTTLISLKDFETAELLAIKSSRTAAEYCWTCTPCIISHSINQFNLDHCTYVDADLFFYSNPKTLIDEMGNDSVLITEHRYTPLYDQSLTSGKYCVQFMTFKNDDRGMRVLNWWKNECLKWCHARFEDGKFGDQKYLDDWTTRFDGVHELQNLGGGVAPWNLQQYFFSRKDNKIYLKKNETTESYQMVFFHFHHLKIFLNNIVKITATYFIDRKSLKYFYFPYIKKLMEINEQIKKIDNSFDSNGAKSLSPATPYSMKDKIHLYKEAIVSLNYKKYIQVRINIAMHDYFYLTNL